MTKLKSAMLTALILAGASVAGTASAAWQVYNPGTATWSSTGTSTFTGPTNASYLGLNAPCDATFTLTATAGVAKITAATFSGSSTCTGITANALPWTVSSPTAYTGANPPFTGAPTLSGTLYSITIGGVSVTIPAPLNVTCTGNVAGQIDNGSGAGSPPTSNKFVFKQTLSNGCAVSTRTNKAPNALVASPTVRWVP